MSELTDQIANGVNTTDSEKTDSVNLLLPDVDLNSTETSKPGCQEGSGIDSGCQNGVGEKPTQDASHDHSIDDVPISCPPGNNTDL